MLISESFESDFSFSGASQAESLNDGSSLGRQTDDQWGLVSQQSNDGSRRNDDGIDESDGSGYAGSGLLILEGIGSSRSGNGSTASQGNDSTLSIPGTDSLPSEIDSILSDVQLQHHDGDTESSNHGHSITFPKRSFFIFSLSAAALFTVTFGYHAWERRSLRSSNMKLLQEIGHLVHTNELQLRAETQRSALIEQEKQEAIEEIERLNLENGLEIERLERENQALKDLLSKPTWDEDDAVENDHPDEFTIVDNCWLKAKARVQFGPCGDEKKSSFSEFTTKAWRDVRQMWNGTSSIDKAAYLAAVAGMAHTFSMNDDSDDDDAKTKKWSFPGYNMGGTASSAGNQMFTSEGMGDGDSSAKFDFEEARATLTQASGAVSEAVLSLTWAMAAGIKDLSNDPVAHLTEAIKGASHASKNGPQITMSGVFEAGKVFSSASSAMGKVMTETSDILAVKVSEMMDDPLSFFEFETEMSK